MHDLLLYILHNSPFYIQVSGKDILEAVTGEFTGDEEDGFKAVG